MLGTSGDEAIHIVLDVMAAGGNAATLRQTMRIHPTVSELVPTIAGASAACEDREQERSRS
jgi:pyruvate/2-oxoglutarate dehydrogenase complex dihydrolipoamide dehydrogenase (E3) component